MLEEPPFIVGERVVDSVCDVEGGTVHKVHGPEQHGLSRIMPTVKTTAGTVLHAGTGTVPREVVPDW